MFAAAAFLITALPFQRLGAGPLPTAEELSRKESEDAWVRRETRRSYPPTWLSEAMADAMPSRLRPANPSGASGVSTWTGGTGNWSNGAMWSPIDSPNSSGADVFVDGGNTGTASVVTVDGQFTVGRLTIDAGDTVAVSDNSYIGVTAGSFTGSGTIVNNGTLSLNSTGNNTYLLLLGNGGLTLSGSGVMTMGSAGSNQIGGNTFNALFTNQSTIQGAGSIGVGVIDVNNQSLIDANLPFTGSNSTSITTPPPPVSPSPTGATSIAPSLSTMRVSSQWDRAACLPRCSSISAERSLVRAP